MLHKLITQISPLMLGALILAACQDDDIHWLHVIPDGYQGWVAIQYECEGGIPLDRSNNDIRVAYNADGLFCTTNSPADNDIPVLLYNVSGVQIPDYGDQVIWGTDYGSCCDQRISPNWIENEEIVEVVLDLRWVGLLGDEHPPLDLIAINEAARMGSDFVPADW